MRAERLRGHKGKCPHWLIGGNSGASRVLSLNGVGALQEWWLAGVTSLASFTRLLVTSVSKTRRHRTNEHGPHGVGHAAASNTCAVPWWSVTVALPSAICS